MGLTSVCEVSIDRFEELKEDPAIQHEIVKLMSLVLRYSHELLLLLGKHNAEERIAAFLLNLSKQSPYRHCSATEFVLSMSPATSGIT